MSDIQFISIIAGLVIFATIVLSKLLHQKPSPYCQRLFEEMQVKIEKMDKKQDEREKDTGEMKREIALLIQSNKDMRDALMEYGKTLKQILEKTTEFFMKQSL